MIEYGKPEPDIYIEACRQLKVNPSKAIRIEDAINGIRSAHGAGMNPVMIPDIVQDTSKSMIYYLENVNLCWNLQRFYRA